jgi:hypothetical protein
VPVKERVERKRLYHRGRATLDGGSREPVRALVQGVAAVPAHLGDAASLRISSFR